MKDQRRMSQICHYLEWIEQGIFWLSTLFFGLKLCALPMMRKIRRRLFQNICIYWKWRTSKIFGFFWAVFEKRGLSLDVLVLRLEGFLMGDFLMGGFWWEVFHGRWWWAGCASGSLSMIAERTWHQNISFPIYCSYSTIDIKFMIDLIWNDLHSVIHNPISQDPLPRYLLPMIFFCQSGLILSHVLFPTLTPDFVGSNSFPVMFQGLFGSISFPIAVPCLMKDSFLGWADWFRDGWL